MDEQEKIERLAHIRLIITEILMFLAVIFLVGFLTLIVMGYSFNLREIGGSGDVVERSGLVQISSIPTGATIYIDGEAPLLLSTNASRTMLSGEHEISLAKGGYDGWKKTINVAEGMMYRLNYPRLFKEEREPEEVVRFLNSVDTKDRLDRVEEDEAVKTYGGKLSFVSVSPNNENMVLVLDGLFYILNINDNRPVLKVLEVPDTDGVNVVKVTTINSVEWSGSSERMLAKINDKWVIVNIRDTKDTLWLDKIVKTNVMRDIKIESESGDRLLILNVAGELMELSVRDKKLSETLLDGVEKFDNDGERIVYLTRAKIDSTAEALLSGESTNKEEWQVRAYRMGESESYVVKRFRLAENEELGSLRLATMRYFQESYVGIAHEGEFEVYSKTGWVAEDEDMKKIYDSEFDASIAEIKKRGKGMVFELQDRDGNVEIFDIEAMGITRVNATDTEWIDEYLRYRLADGKLSVLDYDGLNERVLVESDAISGHTVAISGNNRWLYYFIDIKETEIGQRGEVLVREKIN